MAGKIPSAFIDQLLMRVDIVDVIDRRVPLARKGREAKACCPFHDEKTPSFTVSPSKQFYHCFGCGAHGSAIGFLMDYANLSFVEAVEELAESVGLPMPSAAMRASSPAPFGAAAGESPEQLFAVVAHADRWFQQQLRDHPEAKQAVAYLKKRGLDGRIAADFGIGYAPRGWGNLARALGHSEQRRQLLLKAGLLAKRDSADGKAAESNLYDRFRSRVIFPIEDHRGRVAAFGGRLLGDGEPKYLNSPETPLFHKGAELYRLHRARRAIGQAGRSLVVEGYMDALSLAQFGVDNAVAALGTATTRTHLQRLFQLAPEIVFCFDGDRAGRDAAWKALQTALPEMRDGRQISFLFLADGEDPDSVIRAEKKAGFTRRIKAATPLPDFLLDSLIKQVDMTRLDGKARLLSLAKPLIGHLPDGALRQMMLARLSALSGLAGQQLGEMKSSVATPPRARSARPSHPPKPGQISPLAFAVSLLLQNPELAAAITDLPALKKLDIPGADILLRLLEKTAQDAATTTARLLESFREEAKIHAYLQTLATRKNRIHRDALASQFNDTLTRLLENQTDQRRLSLIEKLRQNPQGADSEQLKQQMKAMLDARNEMIKARANAHAKLKQ